MEISSMLLERGLASVNELALPVAGASCLYLMVRSVAPAAVSPSARPRRRRSRLVRRGVSLLGLVLSVGSPASAAGRRHPPAPAVPEVRTEPGRFPPPRLPGSAGPLPGESPPRTPAGHEPPWKTTVDDRPRTHPVVHGGALERTSDRLFGRWRAPHPAEPVRVPRGERWHAVLPGETLWSIAAERLRTDDVRRIARYWPRIHRANRDEIGPNPNLIRPGQVLELPPEEA